MRKTKKEQKVITVETTQDILCNKCGKSCITNKKHKTTEGLIEVEVHGGYDSKVIGDLSSWRFSVCEDCLSSFVKTFKIPVDIKDHELHDYLPAPKAKALYEEASKKNLTRQILELVQSEKMKIKGLKSKLKKMNSTSLLKYLKKLQTQIQDSKLQEVRQQNFIEERINYSHD